MNNDLYTDYYLHNSFAIKNRKTFAWQKLFNINPRSVIQKKITDMTHDHDHGSSKTQKAFFKQKLFRINPIDLGSNRKLQI